MAAARSLLPSSFLPGSLFVFCVGVIAVAAACSGSGGEAAPAVDRGAEATDAPQPTDASPSEETAPDPAADSSVPESTVTAETETDDRSDVVFADDFGASIVPIFADNCASCHNAGGPGAPHWQLATVADIGAEVRKITGAISVGLMPPWPAGDLSVEFHNDRRLDRAEIDAVLAWERAGAPIDVAPDTAVVSPVGVLGLSEVDATLGPHEPFDGSPAVIDDYRCLIYDPQLTAPAWIQGFDFRPDEAEIVHHAIGYLLPAEAMDAALARSAEDQLGGWQCYGSSGLPFPDPMLIGWAPGQGPTQFERGTGVAMGPGDFLVLQIHYHNEVDVDPDESLLALDFAETGDGIREIEISQYVAPAEIPCSEDESGPLCDRDAALAAAKEKYGSRGVQADMFNALCGVTPEDFAGMTSGIATSSCDLPIYRFGEIVSILGHEHEIGRSFRMTLNPGTSRERILLDIPRWDFDWQFNYYPVESIELRRGDTVRIECSWDRSLRDPSLEPSYVLWADGTDDEMCFSTISTVGVG